MAPFLLLVAISFQSDKSRRLDPRMLALFLLSAYILHQFEEHWVDLMGRSYAFKPYINDFLSSLLGIEGQVDLMSDASVFVINTSLVWLVGALAIWRGAKQIFTTLCMASIVIVNGISHIAAALIAGGYNPGLLTAVLVFLPLGVFAYSWLLRNNEANLSLVIFSIVWGMAAHVIMIGGILMLNQFDQLPESLYFLVLIAWSILPALLFRNQGQRPLASTAAPNSLMDPQN